MARHTLVHVTTFTLALLFALPPALAAQPRLTEATTSTSRDDRVITRLNTPRRLIGPLPTREAVRRSLALSSTKTKIQGALSAAGLAELSPEVIRLLSSADPESLRDVSMPVGQTFEWMALTNAGKPDVLRRVRWGGRAPFGAFEFSVDDGKVGYTFVLPKDCGNLALLRTGPSPAAEMARRNDEARQAEQARQDAQRQAEEARRVDEARQADEARRAAEADAARKTAEADAEAARKFAEAEAARRAAEQAQQLADEQLRRERVDFFVAGYGGKERRVRLLETGEITGICSPLFGVKGGPDFRLGDSRWRLAPAVGAAFNSKEASNSSMFVEVELNYWFTRGFIGTGIGGWDLTHEDMRAPTWLFQGGTELYRTANESKLLFTIEGRLFLDEMDEIENNYQFWGGVRMVFR